MTASASIRAARVQLAYALMEADQTTEAATMLHGALAEAGDDPPDWRIHLALGRLLQGADAHPTEGMSEVLVAALGAPFADAEEAVQFAIDLLRRADRSWVSRLDPSLVENFLARAREPGAPSSMVSLAAVLSMLQGSLDTLGSIVSGTTDEEVRANPAIGAAQSVAMALRLIDNGDFSEALAHLDSRYGMDDEPAEAAARSMALYGEGDLDRALEIAVAAPLTFETAVAQALVWLRRAGEGSIDEDEPNPIAQASRAASMAARLDPSLPEGLLLRAQVELEGPIDVEGGRRLLEQAVRRLDGELGHVRLWRLQRQVRSDDVFRYMQLEVAAACNRTEELLAIQPTDLPFTRTVYRQDAALAHLVAVAKENDRDAEGAAEMYKRAASFYTYAGELDLALETSTKACTLHPTADGLIQLADDLWQASYRHQEQSRDMAEGTVAKGLEVLDRLDSGELEVSPSAHVEGAYRRGLLLARRTTLGPVSLLDQWLPLPWLLAAALDDPAHSYRAAHLAFALNRARLARAALHYADKARLLTEDDAWVREAYVVMSFNWYGVLDAHASEFLDGLGHDDWAASMRETDAVNRGTDTPLRDYAGGPVFDAIWARSTRAQTTMRVHGLEEAQPLYRELMEEAAKDLTDPVTASECALALRDVDAARRYIADGVAERMLSTSTAEFRNALIDLVTGVGTPVDAIRGMVRNTVTPASLRDCAYSVFSTLAAAWPECGEAVTALQQEMDIRIAELATLPPLAIEVDQGVSTSTDATLDELIRVLLSAEEQGGVSEAGVGDELRRLAADSSVLGNTGPVFDAIAAVR